MIAATVYVGRRGVVSCVLDTKQILRRPHTKKECTHEKEPIDRQTLPQVLLTTVSRTQSNTPLPAAERTYVAAVPGESELEGSRTGP